MNNTARLGTLSVTVVVVATLAGGFLGGRVLAGGSRLSDHLRLYTAIVGAVEQEYADEVKSDRLVLKICDKRAFQLGIRRVLQVKIQSFDNDGARRAFGSSVVSGHVNLGIAAAPETLDDVVPAI